MRRRRLTFFHLYNRVLQKYSNLLFRGVLRTPPVEINPESRTVLYTSLEKRSCRAYLLAAKSFLRFHPDLRVVVQDDGSLDARCIQELRAHIRGITVYSHEETRRFIEQYESEELRAVMPNPKRCHFLMTLKLLNVLLRFPGDNVILLDSDIVFLREPTFVLRWLGSDEDSCFYSDGGSRLGETFHAMGFESGKVDVADFNSGFVGFRHRIAQAELAAVVRRIRDYDETLFQNWEIEQAIWAVLLNRLDNPICLDTLSPGYIGNGWRPLSVLEETATLVHFVGSCRFKKGRYLRLAHRVLKELREGVPDNSRLSARRARGTRTDTMAPVARGDR